jgi:hypothetical protein
MGADAIFEVRMRYKHMVIYVGRSSVFTDQRFTDKLHNTLHSHEEHGWELVAATPRSGPLGDVSGVWLFFKRGEEAADTTGAKDAEKVTEIKSKAA